jgi:hypothetical protein
VRVSIYVQTFLNNLVAISGHSSEEAIAVNAVNALALTAFAFSYGHIQRLDWPHLIIVYHFVLLVSSSNITYFTARRTFRSSKEFGPLMERLAIIDLFSSPIVMIISLALWVGLALVQHMKTEFPRVDCTFGNWVLFGKTVDLGTSSLMYIGLVMGCLWTTWYVVSVVVGTIKRKSALGRAEQVYTAMGTGTVVHPHPSHYAVDITGDYLSAWIWQHCTLLVGDGVKVGRYRVDLRNITFMWRFVLWIYLVIATEQIIIANNFSDENTWTYGQVSALVLLIVPIGALWDICYRDLRWFKNYFDSFHGHMNILYTFGLFLGTLYASTAISLAGSSLFGRLLGVTVLLFVIAAEYLWCS